ncbi:hypothetical protein BaRGS_00035293, partial [Batillaria attramentaria]
MMGVLLKYLLLFSTFPGTAEFWFDGLEIWTKTASEEYADCGEGTCQCTSVQADCSDLYLHAIPDLPAGILQLDLSLNRFTAIDSDIFPDNVTGVISLDFSYNMIRYISDGAFRSLVNLTTVILRGTLLDRYERLSPVFAVPNLKMLVYLNLDSTSLSRLSVDMFANFERLEEVFLGDNKLNSVPDGTFDSLTSLTTLSLSQNSISVVRETTFSVAVRQRLTVLDLSSNPFACSCELRWFQLWLVSSRPLFELFVPAVHIALPVQLVFGFDLNINLSNMGYRDVLNVPPVYVCDNIPNTTVQSFYMPEQACLLTRQAST